MKMMVTWTFKADGVRGAVERFLAGHGAAPEGTKLLGRWHSSDFSGGFALYESDDAVAIFAGAAEWAEVIDIRHIPVVEDAEAGPVLAKAFGK
ncbi:MAG TPA: DUF3303 family protein [Acidobacteriaceae bacterium]|jgi:hypothetical protein